MRLGEGVEDASRKLSGRVLYTGIDDSTPDTDRKLFGKRGEDMNPDGRVKQCSKDLQTMETDVNGSREKLITIDSASDSSLATVLEASNPLTFTNKEAHSLDAINLTLTTPSGPQKIAAFNILNSDTFTTNYILCSFSRIPESFPMDVTMLMSVISPSTTPLCNGISSTQNPTTPVIPESVLIANSTPSTFTGNSTLSLLPRLPFVRAPTREFPTNLFPSTMSQIKQAVSPYLLPQRQREDGLPLE